MRARPPAEAARVPPALCRDRKLCPKRFELFDSNRSHHLRVNRTDVFVGARLDELEAEAVVLIECTRAKLVVDAPDGVRLGIEVLPADSGPDRDCQGQRREVEIMNRNRGLWG